MISKRSCFKYWPSSFPLRLLSIVCLFCILSIICLYFTSSNTDSIVASFQKFHFNDKDNDNGVLLVFDNNLRSPTSASTTSTSTITSTSTGMSTISSSDDERQNRLETAIHYRKRRTDNFYNWFEGNNKETDRLLPNSDANGTILDFAIAGFAKCGTTSMEANLGYIAPLPIGDVCTPVHQTVYYSHINWPKQYGGGGDNNDSGNITTKTNTTKLLRGTKCPRTIGWLDDYSTYLPRTTIIVGIRHPVRFFESFWNLLSDTHQKRDYDPYDFVDHCGEDDTTCNYECPKGQLVCLHKTRFHLPLARMGKTALGEGERQLLAPDDKDGGNKLTNHNITNPIFLYELSQLNEDYLWQDLANMLDVEEIPHDIHEGSHKNRVPGKNRIDICDAYYDDFRSMIMLNAYNMSKWLCDFFVPLAKEESRKDVVIANPDEFCNLVKDYANDPCERLVRLDNGTYIRKEFQ